MEKTSEDSPKQRMLELWADNGSTFLRNKLSPYVLKISKDIRMTCVAGGPLLTRSYIVRLSV
jgi:hypothetical protein